VSSEESKRIHDRSESRKDDFSSDSSKSEKIDVTIKSIDIKNSRMSLKEFQIKEQLLHPVVEQLNMQSSEGNVRKYSEQVISSTLFRRK
jgi:hypothetical protein